MSVIKIKLEPFSLLGEGEITLQDKNGKEVTLTLPVIMKQNDKEMVRQ